MFLLVLFASLGGYSFFSPVSLGWNSWEAVEGFYNLPGLFFIIVREGKRDSCLLFCEDCYNKRIQDGKDLRSLSPTGPPGQPSSTLNHVPKCHICTFFLNIGP